MLRLGNVTQYLPYVPQYEESGEGWEHQKPTSNQTQDTPSTKSAIKNMIIVTSEIHGFQLQPFH